MPKLSEGKYALGGLSLLAVWVLVILPWVYSPAHQTPRVPAQQQTNRGIGNQEEPNTATGTSENKRAHNEQDGGEQGPEFWPPLFGYRLKLTDTLLVLFTAALFIATWFLVTGAEKTAERQLRAYVIVFDAKPRQQIDLHPICTVQIKNFG